MFPTFKEACIALGLLENDGEWVALFREGAEFMTGRALRHLFALALQHTTITNLLAIWEMFGRSMYDDIPHLLTPGNVPVPQGAEEIEDEIDLDYGLYLIQEYLNEFGKTLSEYGLPKPVLNWTVQHGIIHGTAIAEEELNYDREKEQEIYERMRAQLNQEQSNCFQVIIAAVHQHEQNPQGNQYSGFFLQGPAGTGKTFLYNCLCSSSAKVRI